MWSSPCFLACILTSSNKSCAMADKRQGTVRRGTKYDMATLEGPSLAPRTYVSSGSLYLRAISDKC